MSTMRLLTRVAPLAIALAVFLFGTQLVAQTTFIWQGDDGTNPTDWNTGENWDQGTVPTSADYAEFGTSSTNTNVAIPTNGVTVAKVIVKADHNIYLTDGDLTTSDLDVYTNVVLSLRSPFELNVNGALSLAAGAAIEGLGTVNMNIGPSATMSMTIPTGYLTTTAYIGQNVTTYISNPDCMQSDLVFYGDIDLQNGTPADFKDGGLRLGKHDLYLGKTADVITGLMWNSTASKATAGFIMCESGNDDVGQGRVKREFNDVGDQFFYPVGQDGDQYTPIYIRIDCETLNALSVTTAPTGEPFPYISVRAVLQKGGDKGHPANENSSEIQVYWVVKDDGPGGLPGDYPYPNTSFPSIGFAGVMFFSNAYRTGQPDSLYSAVYYDLTSNGPSIEDATNPDDYVGPWSGVWYINGSEVVDATTGDIREIPFGSGIPSNYQYTWPSWSYYVSQAYPSTVTECSIGFGDYSVGVAGDIMPVELTSFSARYYMDDNSVQLKWLTATEENNLGFWVERSVDGESWETLPDFVQGAGNSSVPLSYEYTDNLDDHLAQAPKIAYRLRQVDRDGTIDYSSIVYVYTGSRPETVELYKAYPNPFNPSTTLSFSLEEAQNVTLRVYNTLGMEVATLLDNRSMDAGFHNIEFNGNDLVSGIYIAVLEAAGTVQQQKLVLSK